MALTQPFPIPVASTSTVIGVPLEGKVFTVADWAYTLLHWVCGPLPGQLASYRLSRTSSFWPLGSEAHPISAAS